MKPPVSLHIDRLVLDGLSFTPAEGARVRRALEHELARLWTQRATGTPVQALASPALRAPALTLRAGAKTSPAAVGRDAARSLFAMLEAP
jgi:hypothetical protein